MINGLLVCILHTDSKTDKSCYSVCCVIWNWGTQDFSFTYHFYYCIGSIFSLRSVCSPSPTPTAQQLHFRTCWQHLCIQSTTGLSCLPHMLVSSPLYFSSHPAANPPFPPRGCWNPSHVSRRRSAWLTLTCFI